MASPALSAAIPVTPPAQAARTVSGVQEEQSTLAQAADKLREEQIAAQKNELLPDNLMIRLDHDAQRFVQTITDAQTDETLLRYPSEEQLAYSRAVMAYLRARLAG